MNVKLEMMKLAKSKARKEYEAYAEAIRAKRKEGYLQDMKKMYYHLAHGRKVLDIYAVMQKHGLNSKGQPKLAICRADAKTCTFEYIGSDLDGRGTFSQLSSSWRADWKRVALAPHTFKYNLRWGRWDAEGRNFISPPTILRTAVPIVPARLLPKGSLHNYYVLWEVDKWIANRPPSDPILLKRISANLFAVLAVWDLTPLEKAIVRGR